MGRVTPIIRRPGGKGRMLRHLLPVIDGTPHKVYVEPCCGGAAVLLAKRPSYHEVLNDTDGELINLYKQVKYHLPAVIRETRLSVDSRQLFAESKGHPHRTEIQRAAGYLYRNLYSFGADAHSYGVKRLGRNSASGVLRRLAAFNRRLDRVTVESLDWERCVRLYDCPEALHFIDPPYTTEDGLAAYKGWTGGDVERLRGVLAGLKGTWVVTLNDSPPNRAAFKGCRFKAVSTHAAMTNKDRTGRRFAEIIITP
ncbi:MAG: DNA adenine methylase [Kiritimatiellaeota bacterium]|nr:DNA adenine methylase [Kiritimatiellota bacterium]